MIYSPIWKDIEFKSSASTLDYLIRDDESEIVHTGYAKRMPDQTGVTININTRVEELLGPDFDLDIREADDDVIPNGRAYRAFSLGTGSTELESYGFLYDWSYEDRWTGQTGYFMTEPINGHIDPRMKTKYTVYNTGETTFNWEIEYEAKLEVFPTNLRFSHTGGSETVNVSSNDCWEITSIPDWITASITADCGSYSAFSLTQIVFTADAYTGDTRRTGNIVLTFSEGSVTITVVQEAYVSINVVPTSLSYVFTGETKQVSVTSNGSWWIASKPDWISSPTPTGYKNATVNLTASVNPSSARSGVVVFQTNSESVSVNVTQEAWTDSITITPSVYVFPSSGGSKTFTVSSNVAWAITNTPDWLTFSGAMSGNSGSYNIIASTVAPNNTFVEKSGTIVASGGTATASANVGQARLPMTLSVSPTTLGWFHTGGTRQVSVTSNYGWDVSSNTPSWITVAPSSGGSGTTVVTIDADANFSGYYRTGSLNFYNADNVVTVNLGEEDGAGGDYWIVCDYEFPQAGDQTLFYRNATSSGIYGDPLDDVMIVDGYMTSLSKTYNFDTAGHHVVKYRIKGNSGGIASATFEGITTMTDLYVPENITWIANAAFSGCTSLSAVTIEAGAFRAFGEACFIYCTSLKSIVFPSTTRSMNGDVFAHCSGLTSVTMNEGLTGMTENDFGNCESLTDIVLPNSLKEWGQNAFTQCHSLSAVTLGTGLTTIESNAFQFCTSLTAITIPANIQLIDDWAFYGSGIMSITAESQTAATTKGASFQYIPIGGTLYYPEGADYSNWFTGGTYNLGRVYWNTVQHQTVKYTSTGGTVLPNYYFQPDEHIISNTYDQDGGTVEFERVVGGIDNFTVIDRSEIETLEISDTFRSFNAYFSRVTGNANLLSMRVGVDFGETPFYEDEPVLSIGPNSFSGNTSLTGITFERNVSLLGGYAFRYCENLTDIYFYGETGPAEVYQTSFRDIAPTGVVHYPSGATDSYSTLIGYLPQGWTAVGDL